MKILYDECEFANDTSKIIIDSNNSEMGGMKHQLHVLKESCERLEKEKVILREQVEEMGPRFQ